jgi:hypothetical protein
MGVSGQHHAPAALYPRYPLYRRLGGPRGGLDAEARGKILCLCRGLNPGRPVRSQTLHWLSYSGSRVMGKRTRILSSRFPTLPQYKITGELHRELDQNFKLVQKQSCSFTATLISPQQRPHSVQPVTISNTTSAATAYIGWLLIG